MVILSHLEFVNSKCNWDKQHQQMGINPTWAPNVHLEEVWSSLQYFVLYEFYCNKLFYVFWKKPDFDSVFFYWTLYTSFPESFVLFEFALFTLFTFCLRFLAIIFPIQNVLEFVCETCRDLEEKCGSGGGRHGKEGPDG